MLSVDFNKIDKRRREKGLSKKEVSRRAGISQSRFVQIEQESRSGYMPYAPTLKKIAQVLDLEVSEVLQDSQSGNQLKPTTDGAPVRYQVQEE